MPFMSKSKLEQSWRPENGWFSVLGPGLMVCLATSDVGGLFTMAVSGASTSYLALLLQPLLIPALYMAQELTVRLGAYSHRSLSGLASDHLGRACGTLTLIACVGVCMTAVVSEFTGLATVGELWGIPRIPSCLLSAALLSVVVLKGCFQHVEKVGLLLAGFTCVFVALGFFCRPSMDELQAVFSQKSLEVMQQMDVRRTAAANFGTIITPWMLFYQLSAMVEKRLTPGGVPLARLDTAVGTVMAQAVLASVLMIFARFSRGADLEHMPLHEVLVVPLQPLLGNLGAKVLMTCFLMGSSMLVTLLAALTVAWNCGDTVAARGTSSLTWRLVMLLPIVLGTIMIGRNLANIVHLNISIQVVNGLSMPFIVAVLFLLARSDALPPGLRLQGTYSVICSMLFSACAIIAVACAVF